MSYVTIMQTRSRPSLTGTGVGRGALRRAIAGWCTVSKPSVASSRTCNREAVSATHCAWGKYPGSFSRKIRVLDKPGSPGHGAHVTPGAKLARRYASWIEHRRSAIILGSLVFAALAGFAASKLRIFADFSYLLPQDVRSVTDLRAIGKRARVLGTAMVAVQASDPAIRERAAVMLRDKIAGLPLVSSVTFDDHARREYGWQHRWLFADLSDLQRAKAAIEAKIRQAKLEANPLFVGLDDEPASHTRDAADELRDRLRKAEADVADRGELISHDGQLQMMIIRTAFSSGEVERDKQLLAGIDQIMEQVRVAVPGADIGVAGDIVVSIAGHGSILNGMLLATAVTVTLVMI